ncbi:MAG: hypothetical protein C0631_16300 [Sedimenticola sp.]|jgi:hypothetical protein|nr:MAG: hypothetical protein C0631_16300 [Sedimenticola sp.]
MTRRYSAVLGIAALVATLTVQAHDPSEHKATDQKPDCAAMNTMDHSKVDPNDPVMLAMMRKCKDAMETGSSHGMHADDHQGVAKK